MQVHNPAFRAAVGRAASRPFRIRLAVLAVATAIPFAAWAQAVTAPPAGTAPADPDARVPRVGYRSTLGAYTSRRPVEPKPWREQNRRVAPGIKP